MSTYRELLKRMTRQSPCNAEFQFLNFYSFLKYLFNFSELEYKSSMYRLKGRGGQSKDCSARVAKSFFPKKDLEILV